MLIMGMEDIWRYSGQLQYDLKLPPIPIPEIDTDTAIRVVVCSLHLWLKEMATFSDFDSYY